MWVPIIMENEGNILEALNGYILNLMELKKKIMEKDREGIYGEFVRINKIRDILDMG